MGTLLQSCQLQAGAGTPPQSCLWKAGSHPGDAAGSSDVHAALVCSLKCLEACWTNSQIRIVLVSRIWPASCFADSWVCPEPPSSVRENGQPGWHRPPAMLPLALVQSSGKGVWCRGVLAVPRCPCAAANLCKVPSNVMWPASGLSQPALCIPRRSSQSQEDWVPET